ncbi:MAG TPA: protein-L-isoaspartate O-methyltransferase, partial [Flavilitoribacter sp.]|nr:protein-L-isoaspartate O-methyltransferase [Flavilitoribacter sp.]
VLEVGTGSGYQSAVLALLGARVYTVERFEPLFLKAKAMLEALGLKGVRCFHRDGYKGLPEFAPFDRILVTAGAPEIPENLLKQLTIGGMMVIPVGEKVQKMYRITRLSETEFREETFHDFQFVPFLPGLK